MRTMPFAAVAGAVLAAALVAGCKANPPVAGHRAAAEAQRAPTSTSATTVTPTPAPVVHREALNRCRYNRAAQKVIVSIEAQRLWMCAHHRLVRQSAVTTGMVGPDTDTPTGNYWIQSRNRDTTLTLNTGATYAVKYWIPFQAPLFGFHDASWQNFPFGSAKYKTDGSHGCVHMPLEAIAFLYRWSARPTAVHIS